jgi:hypothetical protein
MAPAGAQVSGSDGEQVLIPPFLLIIYSAPCSLLVQTPKLIQRKNFRRICALYRHDLTAADVRSLLDYNPNTGALTWRATKSGRRRKVAGTTGEWGNHGKRRRTITIDYVIYKAHRIIWLWMTGKWPTRTIDHVNRNALDNRWKNLRLATPLLQVTNRDMLRNNKSGTTGVFFDKSKKTNPWRVEVRNTYVGVFPTKEAARKIAKRHFLPKEKS